MANATDKRTPKTRFEEAHEKAVELRELFDDRIVSMADAAKRDPLWCQARHSMVYYRSLLYEMMDLLDMDKYRRF